MIPLDALGEKLALYRKFPRAMVMEQFGVTPDPAQEKVLDIFPRSPRIAMQSCTGAGKTSCLAWLGWNFLLTRDNPMIGCASVTRQNLDANLWPELSRWHARWPLLEAMFEITADEIRHREFPRTWKLEARGWRADADATQIGNALRGLHAPYVMWLLDETGAMPDAVLPTCEAIFSGEPVEAHIVQAGNPTHLSGPLYFASRSRRHWIMVEITADPDDPRRSPRVSIEHARQQIAAWGRDSPWVIVNIFGKFPPASINALISADEVETAMRRYWRPDQIGEDVPRIIGVDVARYGDDASCLSYRQGIQMFPAKRFRDLNSTQGAGIVAREWDAWRADAVFVDDTGGFGAGWIDRLHYLGRSPIGVGFATKAHKPERYFNKRAEMAFDLITWIKAGGALPQSPQLKNALVQTTYTFAKNSGAMILEPKEAIKDRLGYSPDEFDSAILTFAEPVTARVSVPRVIRQKEEDWNPFAEKMPDNRWKSSF